MSAFVPLDTCLLKRSIASWHGRCLQRIRCAYREHIAPLARQPIGRRRRAAFAGTAPPRDSRASSIWTFFKVLFLTISARCSTPSIAGLVAQSKHPKCTRIHRIFAVQGPPELAQRASRIEQTERCARCRPCESVLQEYRRSVGCRRLRGRRRGWLRASRVRYACERAALTVVTLQADAKHPRLSAGVHRAGESRTASTHPGTLR